MRIKNHVFLLISALTFGSCSDDEGNKGILTISITDSPMDADQVKGVNLFINHIDAKKGGAWMSLKSFDQPAGVNLLEFSGGKSFSLVNQFIDPGKYTDIRFTFNLIDPTGSLIRSPQCNVSFEDGSTKPLYYFEEASIEFEMAQEMNLASHGQTDFTLDFDLRKSLSLDDQGNFIFKPVVRAIETIRAGHIMATVTGLNLADRLVVFAYPSGQFSTSETATPAAGEVRFPNAVTSFKIAHSKFGLGFLPAGNYDLIFVKHLPSGEFLSVSGRLNNVNVPSSETVQLDVDLTQLSGS